MAWKNWLMNSWLSSFFFCIFQLYTKTSDTNFMYHPWFKRAHCSWTNRDEVGQLCLNFLYLNEILFPGLKIYFFPWLVFHDEFIYVYILSGESNFYPFKYLFTGKYFVKTNNKSCLDYSILSIEFLKNRLMGLKVGLESRIYVNIDNFLFVNIL